MGRRFSNGLPCPLSAADQAWIDRRWLWLAEQFGTDFPVNRPVILPSAAYFANTSTETVEGIEALFSRVCEYMNIDRNSLVMVQFDATTDTASTAMSTTSALGYYRELESGKFEINVSCKTLEDPFMFVGTVAHELAHVHLLGHRRVTTDEADHEHLTDLLPIFFGVGIFGANSVIYEKNWRDGNLSFWQAGKSGYMSMAMHSYALAKLAHHRQESTPMWAGSLRPDIRAEVKLFLSVMNGESTLFEDPIKTPSIIPGAENTYVDEPSDEELEEDTEDEFIDEYEYTAEEILGLYRKGTRDFTTLNMSQMQLSGAELNGCNFTDCDFSAADLSHAQLMDCNFTGATFKLANLEHAKMNGSILQEAIFHLALLNYADLQECNLCDADFRGSELNRTDITGSRRNNGTDFYGVDLSRIVCDQNLTEEVVHSQKQLEQQYRAEDNKGLYYFFTGLYACFVMVTSAGVQYHLKVEAGVSTLVNVTLFILVIVYRVRKRMRYIQSISEPQPPPPKSTTYPE